MSEPAEPTEDNRRRVSDVTPAELDQVDFETPIAGLNVIDDQRVADTFRQASQDEGAKGNASTALVYGFLQAITEMHFRPNDRGEPFGPRSVLADGSRTMIPADISADVGAILAAKIPSLANPVLRARVADVVWTNNRKLGALPGIAVDAYCESIERLRAGTLKHGSDGGDLSDYDVVARLRRACHIVSQSGGKKPLPDRIKALVIATREDAYARRYKHGFLQSAALDLDFGVSDAAAVAREAETIHDELQTRGDGHEPLAFLELSARGFRLAHDKENEDRLTLKAAESCVLTAADLAKVPMLEAHWLTRAIAILGRVRAQKDRRNELRKCLIDVQARMMDEFVPIGHKVDVRDVVEAVEKQISSKSLAEALFHLIGLHRSRDPVSLRAGVMEQRKGSILASMFSTGLYDKSGKLKFQSPGLAGADQEGQEQTLRFEIIQSEDRTRRLIVGSAIEPARQLIEAEHAITMEKLFPLIQQSPFVEPGYELVFAQGITRWFNGDSISATSILVPQLENSLRYLLRNAGHDVSTMKNDGTQEDRSIQALFDQMRPELVEVLGEPIVFEIENLFLLKAGPGVRHAVAHGLFSTGHFFAEDANYACWFIYKLCLIPLMGHWPEVAAYLEDF